MRDLGIEKLANPLIGVNYRASLGSAIDFKGLGSRYPPVSMFVQYSAADMYGFDAMASLIIGVALVAALYVAVRLVLRYRFPPDT
jgi:hypothetical protein